MFLLFYILNRNQLAWWEPSNATPFIPHPLLSSSQLRAFSSQGIFGVFSTLGMWGSPFLSVSITSSVCQFSQESKGWIVYPGTWSPLPSQSQELGAYVSTIPPLLTVIPVNSWPYDLGYFFIRDATGFALSSFCPPGAHRDRRQWERAGSFWNSSISGAAV